jgi:hypothetical protein
LSLAENGLRPEDLQLELAGLEGIYKHTPALLCSLLKVYISPKEKREKKEDEDIQPHST